MLSLFDVKTEVRRWCGKKLYRNHLFMLSFMNHETETERKDYTESDAESLKEEKTETEDTTAVGLNGTDSSDEKLTTQKLIVMIKMNRMQRKMA